MILNVLDAVDKHLIKLARNNYRDNTHFHPSSWDDCKRKHAYAYYESKGFIKLDESAVKIAPQLERIFGNGHSMHDRWRSYLESTGALMGVWECENIYEHKTPKIFGKDFKLGCLKPEKCSCGSKNFRYHEVGFLDHETMWGGHCDAVVNQKLLAEYLGTKCKILPDEELILIDFKTINSFEFKTLDKPKPNHATQMQIYLYLAGLRYGKFLYEDKNSQSVKEYIVIADESVIMVKKEEALNLKKIVTMTVKGKHKLPQRGFPSKLHQECKRCKYSGHCWMDRTQQAVVEQPKLLGVNDV